MQKICVDIQLNPPQTCAQNQFSHAHVCVFAHLTPLYPSFSSGFWGLSLLITLEAVGVTQRGSDDRCAVSPLVTKVSKGF